MSRAALLAYALLAACGIDAGDPAEGRVREVPRPVPNSAVKPTTGGPATPTAVLAKPPTVIPADTRQLIVARAEAWTSTAVSLTRYERDAGGAWRQAGPPWRAVIGKTGMAWGRGRHGDGAPSGEAGPVKQEGDGATPAGVFELGAAFGYAATPPEGAKVTYTRSTASWHCVDDGASTHYDDVLDATGLTPDWTSAEDMKRADELYEWLVVIAHNPARVVGGGSCIFFHVWRDAASPTVGCTAMPKKRMLDLLGWLDPATHPLYVALPTERYQALAKAWQLP